MRVQGRDIASVLDEEIALPLVVLAIRAGRSEDAMRHLTRGRGSDYVALVVAVDTIEIARDDRVLLDA